MKTTLNLSGNFAASHAVADAMSDLEAAIAALKAFTDAGDYGSADYFEALKARKLAEAEHAKAVRALRKPI